MTTPAEIVTAFDRIERERGGWAEIEALEVVRLVAAELHLTSAAVREAMLDHWTAKGFFG